MIEITHTERMILQHMAQGHKLREVSGLCHISKRKLEGILEGCRERLDVHSNYELMYFVGKNDLLLINAEKHLYSPVNAVNFNNSRPPSCTPNDSTSAGNSDTALHFAGS
jgi:hypothetical protein